MKSFKLWKRKYSIILNDVIAVSNVFGTQVVITDRAPADEIHCVQDDVCVRKIINIGNK